MRALVWCALAACTYPEKELEGPYTCVGASPPTTAPLLVKISGTTIDPSNRSPLAAVSVALQTAQMSTIFSTVTDGMGRFSFQLNTNGTPVSGLDIFASAFGRVDSYYFPSRPVAGDLDLAISVISSGDASALFAGAAVTKTSGDGTLLFSTSDCTDLPLAGATVTSSPTGVVRYFDTIQPSPTATATDVGGVAMIANLPPGKATVTVNVDGKTLPPRMPTIVADAFSLTDVQP